MGLGALTIEITSDNNRTDSIGFCMSQGDFKFYFAYNEEID